MFNFRYSNYLNCFCKYQFPYLIMRFYLNVLLFKNPNFQLLFLTKIFSPLIIPFPSTNYLGLTWVSLVSNLNQLIPGIKTQISFLASLIFSSNDWILLIIYQTALKVFNNLYLYLICFLLLSKDLILVILFTLFIF